MLIIENLFMSEKNYVIAGGSSGIGAGIAEILLSEGNRVWILSRTKPALPGHRNMKWAQFDVLDDNSSLPDLPSVVHGAAYCPGSINLRPFRGLKLQDFRNDFEINLIGAVNILQALLKPMQTTGEASVVMFSTVAVQQGMPFHASVAAAKGAVEGFVRSLAAELAPKVRVNCIAPSLTVTPMADKLLNTEQKRENSAQRHPMKRIGTVNDIASMAAFLLSARSGWITGQVIGVDGGLSSLKV